MVKKFGTTRIILFLMLTFQIAWLEGIWITGASDNWQKLLIVGVISILAYLAVNLLQGSFFERIGVWINWLANNQGAFIASLAVVLLTVGIFYASLQRVWPWDEEENFQVSQLIAEKGLNEFFGQYAQTNYLANRHPPLIFMINGLAVSVFGVNLMTVRMVSLLFGFGMLVTSYFLASNLYGKRTAILTVLFLISFPLIIRESTAGLLDVQATFFFVATLLLALKLTEKPSWKLGVVLGLSLGLGLLTKYMVMFVIPVLFLIFIVRRNYRAMVVPVFLSFLMASVLFLIWTWYGSQIGVRVPSVAGWSPSDLFASKQVTRAIPVESNRDIEQITITPGYFLTSEWGRSFLLNSLITRLPSGLGAYNLPLILFGLFFLIRQKRPSDLFVLMWIGVVSILLILTLPDHRYFMVIFPALAMASASWTESRPSIDIGRVTLLLLIYQIGSLYIFVDWSRIGETFIR